MTGGRPRMLMMKNRKKKSDRADDRADRLDAEPVGDPQVARVAGQREALLGGVAERRAGHPRHAAGEAGRQRAQGALDERLLELELLEVLGLHRAELGQPGLDRIDRRAAGQAEDDEQDGGGRDGRR